MGSLAIWILAFHDALGTSVWWAEVFHVLPFPVWVCLLGGIGAARVYYAKLGHGLEDSKKLAIISLISCFLFCFLSFLVGIVRFQMSVTPIFFWLAYQSGKSYLRLNHSRMYVGSAVR
jgi:hypothetical protein